MDENTDFEARAKLVADLLGVDYVYQFCVYVQGNKKMEDGIMQFSVSDYQKWIEEINDLPESAKMLEQAKLRRLILNLTQEETVAMYDKIEDMYSR